MSETNITVEAMEKLEEKNKPVAVKNSSFDEKNYLNTRLNIEKGELSKEIRIRILPITPTANTPFQLIHMHTIAVPKEISKSKWKSYVCIEKTTDIDHNKFGNKCPFCELNRDAYKKFKELETSNPVEGQKYKDIAKANLANEVCILRCIERGHEEDGPKFWKFNIRQDKLDPMNLILKKWRIRKDEGEEEGEDINILDVNNGKDLKITITAILDKENKPTNKTSITIEDYGKFKPVSTDPEEQERWINDEKKWDDVFVVKPYEYTSIILEGKQPWFDRVLKKWVTREDVNEQEKEKKDEADKEIETAEANATFQAEPVANNNDDDLPY